MPTDWKLSRVSELATNLDGRRIPVKEAERKSGPYPYYGASGIVDFVDGYLFDGEYLLVAEDGENLRTRQTPIAFLARGKFWVNNHAHIIAGNEYADTRFLMYALRNVEIDAYLTGAVMPKLTQGNLNRIEIPHPELSEQKKIAAVLGVLDDMIEHNKKLAILLEGLARTVFHAWFVDFDPIKAKAAGSASFPSMSQAVFNSLPEVLEESEIGLVPEAWAVKPITELVEINPSRSLRKDEVVPHLDMKNMPTEGHFPRQLTMRPFGSGAKFINGDTLVARITPCLENGKTAFVNFLDEGQIAWGSTEYIVLRPYEPIPAIFAYLLARTEAFRQFAIQSMTGTSGRQRVPFSALSHFMIAEPPSNVLEAFGDLVNPMIERSTAAYVESKKLAEIRDYLLPRLLSGELRVVTESVE